MLLQTVILMKLIIEVTGRGRGRGALGKNGSWVEMMTDDDREAGPAGAAPALVPALEAALEIDIDPVNPVQGLGLGQEIDEIVGLIGEGVDPHQGQVHGPGIKGGMVVAVADLIDLVQGADLGRLGDETEHILMKIEEVVEVIGGGMVIVTQIMIEKSEVMVVMQMKGEEVKRQNRIRKEMVKVKRKGRLRWM